jgi:putative tryptophan/tyrosine transport system substrate-binding protein
MRRRQFIAGLGGAAAWPMMARAQQQALPVVGYLSGGSSEVFAQRLRAFRKGLSEAGYVEGRNVVLEYHWVGDRRDQLPPIAADLVRRQVAVIVADGFAVRPAKAATSTIPVVFFTANDPVASGLVANLNRPGGNLTGVTSLGAELGPKRFELLREAVPAAKSFAVLSPPGTNVSDLEAAGRTLGLEVHMVRAASVAEIDAAFASLIQPSADGLVIRPNNFFSSRAEQLASLALRQHLPAIYQFREFAMAGGLMSYGGSESEPFHTIGLYTGRILMGEKPADLPVHQATKVELILNTKTAKALGLTLPSTLLGRADEVIE